MISQKSQRPNLTGGGWFNRELKFLGLFLALIFSFNFIFIDNTSALFVPTLSVSIDQANLQVNGNQVINSATQTIELPLNFTVNTNNRTGYIATISAGTDNTSLSNSASSAGAKISSISSNVELSDLPNNAWGYRFGASTNYAPIPALSTPAQIVQTTGKTNGNESNQLNIGMKLADNLESGNYTNKLILSFVTNPYQMRAMMMNGPDFNTRVGNLDPNPAYFSGPDSMLTKPSIKAFKRSVVAPANSVSTINIEDPDMSDYEIKAWYNAADQSVYYYAEPNTVFLNQNSNLMFRWFTMIESLDFSNIDTSEVNIMSAMFYWMRNLKTINFGNFNTSKVTDMSAMFGCTFSLIELNLSTFDTSKVTGMSYMFHGTYVQKLDLSSFNTSNVINMYSMFEATSRLKEINFGDNFNTEKVTNMGRMFKNIPNLTSLNLATFNTSNVTNMEEMFYGASKITELNLSNFNSSNVRSMAHMFYSMTSLLSLSLSNFDTKNVEDLAFAFSGLINLEQLDLGNFYTPKLKLMNGIFRNSMKLKTINVSNFDTKNVTDMSFAFDGACMVKELDISSFITRNVKTMERIFGNGSDQFFTDYCRNNDYLEKIYVSNDFDIIGIENDTRMFIGRYRLRGGSGSHLNDPSVADKSWLRIDDPTHGRPGYFTRKS